MSASFDPYAEVFQVLDSVCHGGHVPPGARGTLYSSIDHLRDARSPDEHLRLAEKAAVAVVRMEWALRNRDAPAVGKLKEVFRELNQAWRETPVRSASVALEAIVS